MQASNADVLKYEASKYDARKLSANEQALLRQMAVSRVLKGEPVSQVTQAYGLGDKTIYKWLRMYRESGIDALSVCAKQGRRKQLAREQYGCAKVWSLVQFDDLRASTCRVWHTGARAPVKK